MACRGGTLHGHRVRARVAHLLREEPDYWDADNIHIDRVELSTAPDPSTLVASIQTGVYDFAYGLAPAQYDAAIDADLDVATHPVYSASNLSLNINKAPFDDPAVVDAVRHAIDRDELVEKVTFGLGYATTQPFPEGYIAYDDESEDLWPYDPEESKKILADAGYEPGEIVVDFVVSADGVINEVIQAQLAAVGITANITVAPDWATPFFAKDLVLSTYGTTGRESPVQTLTAHFGKDGPLNLSSRMCRRASTRRSRSPARRRWTRRTTPRTCRTPRGQDCRAAPSSSPWAHPRSS